MEPTYNGLDQAFNQDPTYMGLYQAGNIPDDPIRIEPTIGTDRQEGGDHYTHPIQPIEYIMKNELDFIAGNIVKYATRAPHKGQFESDVKKIIHYAELWLELQHLKYD